ncbi:MAG: 1-deoxy-D-xylulose-5-phosphate synthase [Tidjanibacter sp.]|nr:1-deoxy-D-xylulose-5-phosphate synthase [Tidjanibacter sp.]
MADGNSNNMAYQYLDRVNSPAELKGLKLTELADYCAELRDYIVRCCASNPGHLSSSLGAVELAVAIHYVFDFPTDSIVWDVGHQAYAHKIITGRREAFASQRTLGGLAGFPRMEEGDSFGAGHSSVSISAAYGMAEAAAMRGEKKSVIAVIGDGAMTGGLAFEGLNNAGASQANILVILNDNRQSIDTNVGALKKHLLRITSSRRYNAMKRKMWRGLHFSPRLRSLLQHTTHSLKRYLLRQSNLFESMDFRYFGPTNGHDVVTLVRTLRSLREIEGPKLLHAMTIKGKGYEPAEKGDPAVWHSPGKFDPATGQREPSGGGPAKYQYVFGRALLELAEQDERVVGVTPAMATGSSMNILQAAKPERVFDVGIAEGHAVTFSAGLAAGGMIPFCAIYSSFMQRAYDNVIHDVALQNLHTIFCLDRAGLVGEDGATHHGEFDIAYMRPIPNLKIAAPRNEQELRDMMFTAYRGEGPFVIRYPRGRAAGVEEGPMKELAIGKAEVLREGRDVALLTLGHTATDGAVAAERCAAEGVSVCHIDLRWAKPLDEEMLGYVAANFQRVVTVEDGVLSGGVGSAVADWMADKGFAPRIVRLGIDDRFVEHGTVAQLKSLCGYDAEGIERAILSLVKE